MANKYDTMVSSIVDLVGGKENIRSFAHCVTRLRFNVKDKGMVKVPEIEKLPGAVGVQWVGSQLQVIIGQDVGTVYDRICKEAELEEQESVSENLDAPKAKKTFGTYVNAFFDAISGCIIPLIPMLMVNETSSAPESAWRADSTASLIRSALAQASSSEVSGSSTINSSPPQRPSAPACLPRAAACRSG